MQDNFKNLTELLDYFIEEKTCYEFLAHQIWDEGKPICPHCGGTHIYTTKSRSKLDYKKGIPEYRCSKKECGKKFTATVGTIFHASKLKLRYWYAAIFLITTSKKGISSVQLSEQLRITQKAAWHLLHRIRAMFKETAPNMLKGIVEADETYVGGKNKNRHANKKIQHSHGRSSKDKTPVVGLVERGGKVLTFVVSNTEAETIHPIMQEFVDKDCVLITDSYVSYNGLSKDYTHITVKHSENNYKTEKGLHTNTIENFWSVFKRGIIGIYHYVSPKHLHRYTTEFGYRYNNREDSGIEKFKTAIGRCAKIRLPYEVLTAKEIDLSKK